MAISPLVGGRALKGPAAKMMGELGLGSDALAIARFYAGLIDGLIIDVQDADQAGPIEALGIRALVAPTVMTSLADRIALAGTALDFARGLPGREARRWHAPAFILTPAGQRRKMS